MAWHPGLSLIHWMAPSTCRSRSDLSWMFQIDANSFARRRVNNAGPGGQIEETCWHWSRFRRLRERGLRQSVPDSRAAFAISPRFGLEYDILPDTDCGSCLAYACCMAATSGDLLLRARSRAATSALLVFTCFGVQACGASGSTTPGDGAGGGGLAGTTSNGGTKPDGGASAGASGGDTAAAGVNSNGGSDSGTGGASSGGNSAGGTPSGGKSAGGASGNAGAGGSGGMLGRGCPASAPSEGSPCPPPALLGVTCFYDDCSGAGVRKKATCTTAIPELGNPVQLWSVATSACEPLRCDAMTCSTGQVCVILEGGARIGQCAPQSCGTGPIECQCVKGCYQGCILSPIEAAATFTCNTCADPRGCP